MTPKSSSLKAMNGNRAEEDRQETYPCAGRKRQKRYNFRPEQVVATRIASGMLRSAWLRGIDSVRVNYSTLFGPRLWPPVAHQLLRPIAGNEIFPSGATHRLSHHGTGGTYRFPN